MAKEAKKPSIETQATSKAVEAVSPKDTIKVKEKTIFSDWEYKDRTYRVSGRHNPAIYWLQSRPSTNSPMLYWDEKNNKNRQVRYATNFDSPFKDEQHGTAIPGVIMFEEGTLHTTKDQVGLQQFLFLHPKKNVKFYMVDNEAVAEDQLDQLDLEFEALKLSKELDIDHIEAIMRTQLRSDVDVMTTKELRREARLFAKQDPKYFISLATDEDISLRNIAIKGAEFGILTVTDTQVLYTDTGRKIFDVGFDENPYTKLVKFFKKDEGIDLLKSLKIKLDS